MTPSKNSSQILQQLGGCSDSLTLVQFDACGIAYGFRGLQASAEPKVIRPKQVHGTKILLAEDVSGPEDEADGIYTTKTSVAIAVVTADCLPVLIADRKNRMVMAVHAGWRGLTKNILREAARVWTELGISPADILIGIGPSIGPEVYEVGPEVADAVRTSGLGLSGEQQSMCLTKGQADRWYLDLQVAASMVLMNLGVVPSNIQIARICTYTHADKWHSYRRTKGQAGRNFATIALV